MGTRADFYVGIGPEAEWLGSISHDGYPDGTPTRVLGVRSEDDFRSAVETILSDSGITSTRPAEGWPWPWDDSRTTDYAYAWVDDMVKLSSFGTRWGSPEERRRPDLLRLTDAEVRDMSKIRAGDATVLAKSGLIFLAQRAT